MCNPYSHTSTYFVSILDILLVLTSGYWIAYRMQSETPKEELVEDVEKKEEVDIPEEGIVFYFY